MVIKGKAEYGSEVVLVVVTTLEDSLGA